MYHITSAEFFGNALVSENGIVDIGNLQIPFSGAEDTPSVSVYVRRSTEDLSIVEICLAAHDGLEQESLDEQNAEADRYPLGPKEYWRSKLVGKSLDYEGNIMTDESFEEEWGSEYDPDDLDWYDEGEDEGYES